MTGLETRPPEVAPPFVAPPPPPVPTEPSSSSEPKARSAYRARWVVLPVLAAAAAWGVYVGTATKVTTVAPSWTLTTETLATSGVVQGRTETSVGADATGTLVELRVAENDTVHRGQVLAMVRDRAAEGAVRQAEAALARARSQFAQAQVGSTPEERRAAVARWRGAVENTAQAEQAEDDAAISASETGMALEQAKVNVRRAEAIRDGEEARRELAHLQLERTRALVDVGALAGAKLDEDRANAEIADAAATDAQGAIETAKSELVRANLAVGASAVRMRQAESATAAAKAAQEATQAEYDRIIGLPRPETVAVAAASVLESEAALATARSLAQNAVVRAPFDGTVTQLLLKPGATVTGAGILRLVETGRLEVAADVDESNLARLRKGQRAVVSAAATPKDAIEFRVVRLGSQVDEGKGTVRVVLAPPKAVPTLRPGQTVDVTLVLAEDVKRLTLPLTAVRRQGDETVVFQVANGRAVAHPVRLGRTGDGFATVISGLREGEFVVRDAGRLEEGQRVRR